MVNFHVALGRTRGLLADAQRALSSALSFTPHRTSEL